MAREHEIVVIRPVRARCDDRFPRRAFADCGRESRLDAVPAVTILAAGLVENLEEDAIRIQRRPVPRQRPPEARELLDELIIRRQPLLEIRIGVDVDVHRQTLIEKHFHGGVELCQVIACNLIRLLFVKHRARIDAQADVIEFDRADLRDILRRDRSLEMLLCVRGGIGRSSEPLAQVDAVPQVPHPVLRDSSFSRGALRLGQGARPRDQSSNKQENVANRGCTRRSLAENDRTVVPLPQWQGARRFPTRMNQLEALPLQRLPREVAARELSQPLEPPEHVELAIREMFEDCAERA